MKIRIILCSLVLVYSDALAIEPKPCLPLEPAEVRLEGKIRREKFTTPSETHFILHLAKAVCVKKGDNEFLDENLSIDKIQLVLEADEYKKYRNLVNKFAMANGTLFAAHTAHHHTTLLLSVDKIERIAK